jgi:hypothetical protein
MYFVETTVIKILRLLISQRTIKFMNKLIISHATFFM